MVAPATAAGAQFSSETQGAKIVRHLETMKGERQPHEKSWLDCYNYTFPIAASGLQSIEVTADSAASTLGQLQDGTAADASKTLISSIVGGMTPSSALWFGLEVNGESDDENRWLSESADTLWQNIHGANYDASAFDVIRDAVCAGWFVLYIDEDRKDGGFVFEQWPIGQCFIGASKLGGRVDMIKREYSMTAEQAVNEFGNDNLPQAIRDLAQTKPSEKVKFVHCIEPRKMYVVGSKLAKNLPFASYTVEVATKQVVRESGYHEFPCVVPRVTMIPGSPYAVGWVYDALPDIRSVNYVKRLEFANLDLAVAGMYVAIDDGVLNPKTVKVGGRKVIVAGDTDSIKPLSSGVDFNITFVSEDRLQKAIRKALLADQLQPADGPAMTATEVHARMALLRQLLGPVFGRFQSEWLKPMIERCFGLAYRAGVFSAPPQSLMNRAFTVTYKSPLARAQQLEEVSAIDQHVAGAIQVATTTGDPSVLDNIDMDAAIRFKGEALGIPAKVQRSVDEIKVIRARRAQQQAQAQQQAALQPVIDGAGKEIGKQVANA